MGRLVWDESKLADMKEEEGKLATALTDCKDKLNTLYESDEPDKYQTQYLREQQHHAQITRELQLVRGDIGEMESVRPLTVDERRELKASALTRWLKDGSQQLSQEERELHLGETDSEQGRTIQNESGGAMSGGEVFKLKMRDEFLTMARDFDEQTRSDDDSGTRTGSAGKATQDITIPNVLERLSYFGAVKNLVEVMVTSHGNRISLPQMDGKDDEGEYIDEVTDGSSDTAPGSGEQGQRREGDDLIGNLQLPAIGDVDWDAFLCNSKRIRIRREALDDLVFDIVGRAVSHIHRRIGRRENRAYTKGSGTKQPRGIVLTAQNALTSSITGTFTADDIMDLEYDIDLAYLVGNEGNMEGFNDMFRGRIGYMIHRNVEKVLMKMLDGDGRPLWRAGISEKAPNMIGAGHPYELNNHMDDLASNNKPILFGNFGHYAVRMVNDLEIFRFWDSGTVKHYGFELIGFCRNDGRSRGPLNHSARNAQDGTVCEAYKTLTIK